MAMTGDTIKKVLSIEVQYDKALAKLGAYRKEIEQLSTAEKKLKQDYADGRVSQNAYVQQMSALDAQMKVTKSDMQGLSRAVQNQVKAEQLEKGSLNQLRSQLSVLTREYDNMSRSARNGSQGIMKMTEINKVTKEIKDAEMATQRFYRNVGNYRSALAGVGQLTSGFKTLGTVIGGLLGGLGLQQLSTRMVQVVRDFEDGIARVRAVTNPLAGDFDKLREKALELGRSTRYTATEVASGMEVLGRLGLNANQTIEAITPTLHLAQANAISLADAAQYSASAMRAFGMQTEDLYHINDVFSSACSHSATNMGLLGEAMKTAAPMARTLGVSLEETTALIGGLANVGMTGSDAGTGIKQIITALASAHTTKNGLEILKKYNLEIDSAKIKMKGIIPILKEMKESGIGNSPEDLKTLGGKYAIPRFATLIQNIDEVINLNKTLRESLGENDRMFEQSLGNTSQAIYTMQSAWDTFLIDVNDSTSQYLIQPINLVTSLIRGLSSNISMVGQTIVSVLVSMALTPFFKGVFNNFKIGVAEAKAATEKAASSTKASLIMAENELHAVRQRLDAKDAEEAQVMYNYRVKVAELGNKRIEYSYKRMFATNKLELDKYTRLEQVYKDRIVRLTEEKNAKIAALAKERTEIEALEKEKETAVVKIENEKQVIDSQKKMGLIAKSWANLKAGAQGLKSVFSGVWNTVKGFVWITMIMEAVQAVYKLWKNSTYVKDTLDELNVTIAKNQSSQSIQRLERIHKQLQNIDNKLKSINKNSKDADPLLKEKERLTNLVKGNVSQEAIAQNGITKALADQIKQYKTIARVRAMGDLWDAQVKTLTELGASQNIVFPTIPSTKEGVQGLRANWQKVSQKRMLNGSSYGTWDWITWLMGNESMNNSYTANQSANHAFDIMESLINQGFKVNEFYEKAINETTPNGPELETSDYTKKNGGKDPQKTIANLIAEWRKKYNNLADDLEQSDFSKNLAKLTAEKANLEIDADKILNPKGKSLKEAMAKYKTDAETLREWVRKTLAREEQKLELETSKLWLKYYDTMSELRQDEIKRQTDLVKTQLEISDNVVEREYSDIIRKGIANGKTWIEAAQDVVKQRRALLLQQQNLEEQDADETNTKNRNAIYNKALSGGYNANTRSKTVVGLQQDINDYGAKRQTIEDKHNNGGSDSVYYEELKALDDQYQSESQAYAALNLLDAQYEADKLNRQKQNNLALLADEKATWDKAKDIVIQGIQNKFQELQNGYLRETALAGNYYNDIEYGSQEYWQRLQSRIGERDALELQSQYEQYQKELQFFVEHYQEMGLTQEEFVAKRQELDKKGEEIHIQCNDSITKSDEARWQAASQITGGLSQLVEQMGDEESDAAKLAKVIALAQIAISTGEAIAKMVAAESSKGILGIATTAAGIAEIMVNIATAISTVKSAKFAKGGVNIQGAGTSTSDSIPAYISTGESVMNAKATKMFEPLLLAMNAIGNGVVLPRNNYVQTQQTADLSESFSQAVANIRPVVDVQEITRTQNRVEVIQNLDSI